MRIKSKNPDASLLVSDASVKDLLDPSINLKLSDFLIAGRARSFWRGKKNMLEKTG